MKKPQSLGAVHTHTHTHTIHLENVWQVLLFLIDNTKYLENVMLV